MILGPVNLIDCGVLAFFLVIQIIIQVGIIPLIIPLIKIIPLISACLPLDVLRERFLLSRKQRPQFAKDAGLFEYLVVRFVKYSFKHLPQKVARVLFTKQVAIPLLRWRMLRHGYFRYPVHVEHCTINDSDIKIQGTWIREDPDRDPDFVLYYVHGGGFALGSSYFYLEFLLTWHHLLKEQGFKTPAIFAIDYTLAPDDTYPTQVLETLQGYRHVIKVAKDTSKVCVGGDSAGGALTLSLLLELATQGGKLQMRPGRESHPIKLALPHMAILISPWVTLVSSLHQDSDVDYLDRDRLWEYAHEYVGKAKVNVSPASPGSCTDESLWRLCQPKAGYFVVYSGVEMLAEDARNFVKQQRKYGADVEELDYDGGVHAWPVVCMTTASTRERRLRGVKAMAEAIRAKFR